MKARPPATTTVARPALACVVLAAAAAFALWPVASPRIETPVIDSSRSETMRTLASLDLAAFRTPIWVAEPPPPAPIVQVPVPPPPPVKFQLLAIIREQGPEPVYKAAVYDPDTDRILVVAAGEKLGHRTVDQVDRTSLTLRDDTGKRTLALKERGPS